MLRPSTPPALARPLGRLRLRLLALSEWFIPDDVRDRGHVALLRARFLVLASLTCIATAFSFSALFFATGASSVGAIVPILVGGTVCIVFPFALRAGVGAAGVSHGFILTAQLGLVVSVSADGGLADPGVMWLSMTPLLAAFAGGSRLAWRSAVSAWALVLGLLVLGRMGHVFPAGAFSARPGADAIVLINVMGSSGFVALLASLYEGPMVRHFSHLSSRLRVANEDLRHELAERERAQAAAERDRARAEAASAAKDALLANMSHEFRTPLTAILGFADLLEDEADAEQRAGLAAIGRGAHRLMGTLDGVLELAWLESRAAELDPVSRDVVAPVAAAVGTMRRFAAERGLSLDFDPPAEVFARIDPGALQHIVELLTDNAIRFTDAGGVVVMVRATDDTADGGSVVVEVVDTGLGMSPAFLGMACDPFVQASQGDARTHEGAGVGLAVARRLTDLMGGALAIESTLGQGTTARVTLPLAGCLPVKSALDAPTAGAPTAWITGRRTGRRTRAEVACPLAARGVDARR